MVIHSTFAEFILFLYVHLSHADNDYDPSEMAAIKAKMSSLFPEGTDLERKLYMAIREYNSFDKRQLSDLVNKSLTHFSQDSQVQKTKVYEDMAEIINADGKVNPLETKALDTLKAIIDLNR